MGVRVLVDPVEGACLFDSVSRTAFGTVFESREDAEEFVEWFEKRHPLSDPRLRSGLEMAADVVAWRGERDLAERADD